ncbi:hypothetical protein L1987_45540 [Smallanthus sonchifolius]|uniref:Uncharacterized protein n=1 Tax=Smallanthus sonchifolius TaxID=185202 RepID=A0ACB9FY97_9ASTR|nr:hypothetical protein L1987_45540 [Smallanthus sonchifolius]
MLSNKDVERDNIQQGLTKAIQHIFDLREGMRWSIVEGVPQSVEEVRGNAEFIQDVADLIIASDLVGRHKGFMDGYHYKEHNLDPKTYVGYNEHVVDRMTTATHSFEQVNFPIVDIISSFVGHDDLSELKDLLSNADEDDLDETDDPDGWYGSPSGSAGVCNYSLSGLRAEYGPTSRVIRLKYLTYFILCLYLWEGCRVTLFSLSYAINPFVCYLKICESGS